MKIAYILESTGLSGGAKVVFDQAEALTARRHEVVIFAREIPPAWRKAPCPVVQVEGTLTDADWARFNLVLATFVGHVLDLQKSVPHLIHFTQGYEGDYTNDPAELAIVRAAYDAPVPKVAVSPELARRLSRKHPGRWRWVLQGIDLSRFRPAPRLPGKGRLFVVGPLHLAVKGMPQGLMAADLACRRAGLRLVRMNQVDQRREEKPFVKAHEYHIHVPPDRVPDIYRSCDLFFSPSLPSEGFGLPALEALACGLPCVLTDIPSYRDLADVEDFAVWVPPRDAVAMANGIERLWRDPDLAVRLRKRGPEVAALYGMSRAMDRVEAVLAELASSAYERPAIIIGKDEGPSSTYQKLALKMCLDGFAPRTAADATPVLVEHPSMITVGDLLEKSADEAHRDMILVVGDSSLVPHADLVLGLRRALFGQERVGAAGPISNLGAGAQRAGESVPYHNRRNYEALADRFTRQGGVGDADTLDTFCIAFRRTALEELPPGTLWTEAAGQLKERGWALKVALGAFVHCFGPYYGEEREDIQALIPEDAASVLDVGCAAGELGRALKRKRSVHASGVELNPAVARLAERHLDRVYVCSVEDVGFERQFDCVVCGDLLEHLPDPWAVLEKLRAAIAPGGCLIASLPCITHWSILRDLLEGHFEYLPFGLLCWEHLRFFTPDGVVRLFKDAGYEIVRVESKIPPRGPEGEEFFRTILAGHIAARPELFDILEITVVAKPSG